MPAILSSTYESRTSILIVSSAVLKVRTDRDPQWREVSVTSLERVDNYFEGQVELLMPQCREVAIVFSILDQAKNSGEATYLFTMPRTAANNNDLQLASTQAQPKSPAQPLPQANSLPGRVIQSPHAAALTGDRSFASRSLSNSPNSAIGNTPPQTSSPATPSNQSPTTLATPGAIAWDMPRSAYGNTQDANSVRPANPAAGNFASNALQPSATSAASSTTGSNLANQGNFPTTPRGSNLNAMNRPAGETCDQGSLHVPIWTSNLDQALQCGSEELGLPRYAAFGTVSNRNNFAYESHWTYTH